MEFYLTKDNQQRKMKAGSALYMLFIFIPFVGGLIHLILTIINKQFKGVWLNLLLLNLIIFVIYVILLFISIFLMIASATLGAILLLLSTLGLFGVIIYLYIHLIIHANEYSLSQYLKDGYTITNEENLPSEIKYWIDKNKDKQKPKFLFLNF